MNGSRCKPQLGASWVVDDGNESGDDASSEGVELRRRSTHLDQESSPEPTETHHQRSSYIAFGASAEPELIMPSICDNPKDGIWQTEQQPQLRRSPRKRGLKRTFDEERTASNHDSLNVKGNLKEKRRSLEEPREPKTGTATVTLQVALQHITGWCYDIVGGALSTLKAPISYFLALYLLIGLLTLLKNLLTTSVYSALTPICRIPGISFLDLPMCRTSMTDQQLYYREEDAASVQFDQVMNVQSQFESILEESAGGVSLPLDMKHSETSLRDLRTVIRYSSLPSKNELVFEFNGFIETAGIASSDLQKFNSHVGRAVDSILATARWTKRVLDGVVIEHESRGLISGFFTDRILGPFQPIRFTETTIIQQYSEHTRLVEGEIKRLIGEAQALLGVLHNLDDRLDVIHGVAVRDNLHAQGSKEEVMSHLWTMLGGNRKALGKFESQLTLLNQVNMYRQTAIAHVAGTMLKLQAMSAELEELRERVGTVEVMGERRGIPLSVHIESIELGVERLEQRRHWARGVEKEEIQKALAKDAERDKRKNIASN
ncbi:MAG: hypothetical protein Q9219_002881 [cf. Caloplaca sp. 3 TL-2023]